jgi:transposase
LKELEMFIGQSVFSQLTDYLPKRKFHSLVRQFSGDHKVRKFSCLDQLLAMIFAQLTFCESLRDIEACLSARPSQLYHLGIRGKVRRSTLRDANEFRSSCIFENFAKTVIAQARDLYAAEPMGVDLDATVYAFDSTTISLCLELFPWAKFRRRKAAIKLHTLIDLRGNIPSFILMSQGKMADVRALDLLPIEAGAFYLMDKGYIDYARLYTINQSCAFFVTRVKDNAQYRVVESRPVDKSTGVLCDQTIRLTGIHSPDDYPDHLRRVKYRDVESGETYEFLTNNFELPSLTIAQLYKQRWQVELFFKWIKQHLRIKAFYGTSENAVRVQVWTAITAYALLAIAKKKLGLPQDLHGITQILRLHLFAKTPILQLFFEYPQKTEMPHSCN